jgi:hypothetical protein
VPDPGSREAVLDAKPAVLSPAYLNTRVRPNTAVKVRRDQSGSQVGPVCPKRQTGVLDAFPAGWLAGQPARDLAPGPLSWTLLDPLDPPFATSLAERVRRPGATFRGPPDPQKMTPEVLKL